MKNFKSIISICLALFSFGKVYSQQQAIYTNYLLNPLYYNPAISGSEAFHRANINYRNQWAGFDGAPKTFSASIIGSVKDRQKHGFAGMIVSDNVGLTARTGVYINYSYKIKLNKTTSLRLGVSPGFVQYRVRLYDVRVVDGGDELLTGNVLSANAIDLNSGAYIHNEKFFVGLSANQVLGQSISFTTYNDQLAMHYNLMGGYTHAFKKNFELQPSTLVRYTKGLPVSADFSLRGIFNKNFWVSATYRLSDAASIGVGYTAFNRLTIGYSYDYSLSSINPYQNGTHEIGISFRLTTKKKSLDEEDEELNNSIMEKNKKQRETEEKQK
ncbi:MAG: type IX secretion system membrane protein PorP/SprF [Flavobacteriales bacterium]|nr:type IX secretion system membrane protein PorP/SprF [Flavobacteriales bacterium]